MLRSSAFTAIALCVSLGGTVANAAASSDTNATNGDAAGAQRAFRVFLPVIIEGEPSQDTEALVRAVPGSSGRLERVRPEPLLTHLSDWVDPRMIRTLRSKVIRESEGQWIPVSALRSAGLNVAYDERSLELRITVPAIARKRSTISILGRTTPQDRQREEALAPSTASAYVNAFAAQDFIFGQSNGANTRQELRTDLDGAVNIGGTVLEGSGRYVENRSDGFASSGNVFATTATTAATTGGPWSRGDVRLVHDWEGKSVRFSAGDLSYPVQGFQSFRSMAGLAAVSDFNIQPYNITTPVGRQEIFLRTNSLVRVYVNGRLLQTMSLPAGRHDLRDFPFSVGNNDLTLEITDDVGRVEIVRVPYIYSDQLLAPGVHQVAYAVGVPSANADSLDPTRRTYQGGKETFLLSHRAGVTETLTLGGYGQGDPAQLLVGLLGTKATSIGTFSLEPALSRVYDGSGIGGALRTSYVYTDYVGPAETQRNLTLSVERRSPSFALLGDRVADDPLGTFSYGKTAWDFNGNYGQQIARLTSLNFGAGYQINRPGNEASGNSYTFSSTLGRTWFDGFDTTLTLTRRYSSLGQVDNIAFFLLTWAFPEKKQALLASASTEDYGRVQWNYNSASNQAGAVNLMAGAETTQNGKRVDLDAEYVANRGRLGLVQEAYPGKDPNGIPGGPRGKTSLRAATAVVFASGASDGAAGSPALTLSRPVTDSFVLVRTERGLDGVDVLLNPQQPDPSEDPVFEAASGPLGAAARPELVSYRYDQMHVTPAQLDASATALPRENFILKPTYKSGTLVAIRSESRVYVVGYLVGANGAPVPLWSGELVRTGETPAEKASHPVVFTNREGRFVIEGVQAGRYEARSLDETAPTSFHFTIEELKPGVSRVEIRVKLEAGRKP